MSGEYKPITKEPLTEIGEDLKQGLEDAFDPEDPSSSKYEVLGGFSSQLVVAAPDGQLLLVSAQPLEGVLAAMSSLRQKVKKDSFHLFYGSGGDTEAGKEQLETFQDLTDTVIFLKKMLEQHQELYPSQYKQKEEHK